MFSDFQRLFLDVEQLTFPVGGWCKELPTQSRNLKADKRFSPIPKNGWYTQKQISSLFLL